MADGCRNSEDRLFLRQAASKLTISRSRSPAQARNPPFNPMVNAGAIAIAELMEGASPDERIANMLALFSDLAGRKLEIVLLPAELFVDGGPAQI
jgi:hypothetical protein